MWEYHFCIWKCKRKFDFIFQYHFSFYRNLSFEKSRNPCVFSRLSKTRKIGNPWIAPLLLRAFSNSKLKLDIVQNIAICDLSENYFAHKRTELYGHPLIKINLAVMYFHQHEILKSLFIVKKNPSVGKTIWYNPRKHSLKFKQSHSIFCHQWKIHKNIILGKKHNSFYQWEIAVHFRLKVFFFDV
jgi:hypothetical protein